MSESETVPASSPAQPVQDTALSAGAVLAGALVPGAGHLLLGQTLKAAIFATALLGAIAFGLWKGQYANFSAQAQERHPVMYVLQFATGGPALLAYANTPEAAERSPAFVDPKKFEVAVLFTAVAGLLNVLVLVDLIGLPARLRRQRADVGRSAVAAGAPQKE